MKKVLYILIFSLCLLIPGRVLASDTTLYLFYSSTCPHCSSEREFLDEIKDDYKELKIVKYEVTGNESNKELVINVKKSFGDYTNSIPYTVIGNNTLIGFNDNTKDRIKEYVSSCIENGCEDIVSKIIAEGDVIDIESDSENNESQKESSFTIPLIGKIDALKVSLPIVATVMGLVDGFNPCAMWVLIFLISMLLGMKNRKRMWIIGLTFLITSAVIYLLFMVAWLQVTLTISQIAWVKFLIALVAITGGVINLRSFIKTKNEAIGCTVTDAKQRKKTMEKIKKFTTEKSFFLSIIGVMGLAISINFVELTCSAGLPLLFTQILAINELSVLEYAIYILIYILFYLIDDIIVFLIAMVTLKITGITNKYNKYSHLIGGIIMLIIGLLMIFKPDILMFNL